MIFLLLFSFGSQVVLQTTKTSIEVMTICYVSSTDSDGTRSRIGLRNGPSAEPLSWTYIKRMHPNKWLAHSLTSWSEPQESNHAFTHKFSRIPGPSIAFRPSRGRATIRSPNLSPLSPAATSFKWITLGFCMSSRCATSIAFLLGIPHFFFCIIPWALQKMAFEQIKTKLLVENSKTY